MRYLNWDVLLFPERSQIPIQEFKTTCHIVQDTELQNRMLLLPTVTSFIPALRPGDIFRVSVHCWEDPEPSRYMQSFTKYSELVMFEARVYIDGRLVGSRIFSRAGPWPMIINTSIAELDKNGEFDTLKFPAFHQELLAQSYWNAGDEFGRIKVLISEGFHRDANGALFDRVKNAVAFSFQHAPLAILEDSCIAWPNTAMWRQVSYIPPLMPHALSPLRMPDSTTNNDHSHSPRRKSGSLIHSSLPPPALAPMASQVMSSFTREGVSDPFTEPATKQWRQASSTDISMPDYSCSTSQASHSRRITDPLITDQQDRRFESMQSDGAFESICEALLPPVPDNTPQNQVILQTEDDWLKERECSQQGTDGVSAKYSDRQTVSVTPAAGFMGNIKSRKENTHESPVESARKFAETMPNSEGNSKKRQRVITPAAFKVIDEEDEPRASPSLRKGSQALTYQELSGGERRVLSGIETNIL